MKKKIFQSIISMVLIFIFLGTDLSVVYGAIAVTSVKLNASNINLAVVNNASINGTTYKNTYTLVATVSPSNASDNTVTWQSSNSNIATVDSSGKVTAKASGKTTITAKTSNGKTATCSVNVIFNGNNSNSGRFNKNVLYSTVWPVQNIDIYQDSTLKTKITTISALTEAVIVETNNVSSADDFIFKIKTASGQTGWTKPDYLLINLPDVRDDIVYNVTNAYSSIFKIGSNGTNISQVNRTSYTSGAVNLTSPKITGQKLYTYDKYDSNQKDGKVWNSKLGKYEYVCPVLFKFALMIGTAQNKALQNGYCLKIYDGYRPYEICTDFWNSGLQAIGANMNSDGTAIYVNGSASMKSYSSRTDSQKKATCLTGGYMQESLGNSNIPSIYDDNGNLMNISWFIASTYGKSSNSSPSNHACGTAVDLTMVYKDNKSVEIKAQSDMHDLSLNSLTKYNNDDANMLNNIMTSINGMTSLASEWWHFNMSSSNNSGANGQVAFTDLSDFTASVSYSQSQNVTNDPNTVWAKTAVTVKITSNRPIKLPSGWSYVSNSNYKIIQKTYSSDTSAVQNVTITDYTGKTKGVSINRIQIDSEVPKITKVTATDGTKTATNNYTDNKIQGTDNIANTWFKGNVTVKIEGASDNKGIQYYLINNEKTNSKIFQSTTSPVALTIYDYANNLATVTTKVNIDRSKPSITNVIATEGVEGQNWVNPELKPTAHLELQVQDSGGSGIVSGYEYSTDGKKTWKTSNTIDSATNSYYCYYFNNVETVHFRVKDRAGNYSDIISRNITMIDKKSPTIKKITYDEDWTKELTINVEASDTSGIAGYSFKDEDYNDNNSYTISNNGTVSIKVKDNAGNVSKTSINITNIDTYKPEISIDQEISSDKKIVKLKINAEDRETGLGKYSIDGGNNWINWPEGQDEVMVNYYANTTIPIDKIQVKDKADNIKTNTEPIYIKGIDTTELTVEQIAYSTKELTNQNVIAVIKANKEILAPEGWSLNEDDRTIITKTYEQNTDGDGETVIITDANTDKKLTVPEKIKIENIDKIAPIVNESDITYESTENSTVKVTVKANEELVAITNVKNGLGAKWSVSNEDNKIITTEFKGGKNGNIVVQDKAGNTAKVHIQFSIYGYLESLNPQVTYKEINGSEEIELSEEEYTKNNVKVIITVDREVQNIEGFSKSADGLTLEKIYENYVEEETITLVDNANSNFKEEIPISVNIDKEVPTITNVTGNPENWTNKATLTVNASDNKSGIQGYSFNGGAYTTRRTYQVQKNGEVTIKVKDKAGNESEITKVTITKFDNKAPIINDEDIIITLSENKEKVTLQVNAKDNDSGIKEYSFDSGITWQNDKTYEYYSNQTIKAGVIQVKDNCGNISVYNKQVKIEGIDNTVLRIARIDYSTKLPTKENVTVTVTVNKEIKEVSGWVLSENKMSISKEFTDNTDGQIVTVTDANTGKTVTSSSIVINNIDRIAPIVNEENIIYNKISNSKMQVTITANESIQETEGWTLTNNNILTKTYLKSTENNGETIVIKDLAGNETDVTIKFQIEGEESQDTKDLIKTIQYSENNYINGEATVTVTIITNSEIKPIDGWNISNDGKQLQKTFTENYKEVVTVKDLNDENYVVDVIVEVNSIIKLGDISGNGKINISDLLLLKRHLLAKNNSSWLLVEESLKSADINRDEKINVTDLLLLKRKLLGK